MTKIKAILFILLLFISLTSYSEDKIELRTTTIKGNKELPKILYVVPWKDIKKSKKAEKYPVAKSKGTLTKYDEL